MSRNKIMDINETTLEMIPGLKEEYLNGLLECANKIGADLNIRVKNINIVDDIEMPTATTLATMSTGNHTLTMNLNKQFYSVALGFGPLQIFGLATVIRNAWRMKNTELDNVKQVVTDDYTYDTCNKQEDIIDSYAYGFLVLECFFEDEEVELAMAELTQNMSDDMVDSIIERMQIV